MAAARGALLEVSVALSMNRLAAGLYKEALESSQDALANSQSIFGEGSLETLVPSLLLAESSLGVGKTSDVEELLSAASWVLVQRGGPDDHALRARLLCVRGRLQVQQHLAGRSDASASSRISEGKAPDRAGAAARLLEARSSFAEEAFEASMAGGPGSIEAAAAFFRLGKVATYLQEAPDGRAGAGDGSGESGKPRPARAGAAAQPGGEEAGAGASSAMAFFDKVVETWYQQVAPAFGSESSGDGPDAKAGAAGGGEGRRAALPRSIESVPLASVAEAVGMLREVRDFRLAQLGSAHIAYLEARLALGMCLWAAGARRAGFEECRTVPAAMAAAMEDGHPAVNTAKAVAAAMEAQLDADDDEAGVHPDGAALAGAASGGGGGSRAGTASGERH